MYKSKWYTWQPFDSTCYHRQIKINCECHANLRQLCCVKCSYVNIECWSTMLSTFVASNRVVYCISTKIHEFTKYKNGIWGNHWEWSEIWVSGHLYNTATFLIQPHARVPTAMSIMQQPALFYYSKGDRIRQVSLYTNRSTLETEK